MEKILDREFTELKKSLKNARHQYHSFYFSTINSNKPSVRTVVLRDLNENILFFNSDFRSSKIQDIYSNPQVASIGFTEDKAKSLNKEIKVGKFPLSANGKALALGESEGFIKTLFDVKTGEILGAHMIGPEVTELINTFSLAMKLEATEADIISTVFPHPTLSEAIHESTLDAYNEAIHI